MRLASCLILLLALGYPSIVAQPVTPSQQAPRAKDFDFWIEHLDDPLQKVRHEAVSELGRTQDPRAVPVLIACLGEPVRWSRYHVIRALNELGDPEAYEAVEPHLKDTDWRVRTEALEGLVKMDKDRTLEHLRTFLKESDSEVRLRAVWLIDEYPEAIARPMLAACFSDPSVKVRRWAAESYLRAYKASACPEILELMHTDPSQDVRDAIAGEIITREMGTPCSGAIAQLSEDPDPKVRLAIVRFLAFSELREKGSKEESVRLLLPRLRDSMAEIRVEAVMGLFELHGGYDWQRDNLDPSQWTYADAAKRLYLPGEVAQALIESLKDAEPAVRRAATEALGGLRVREAIPDITKMLEDRDPGLRMAAVNALAKMRSTETIERLQKLESTEPSLGSTAIIDLALVDLAKREPKRWVSLDALPFPAELGIHRCVEAPAGLDRRLTVFLPPEQFSVAHVEALCRYLDAQFPFPESMSVTIETDRQRIDRARDPLYGHSGSRIFSNEERLQFARESAGFKNTYL
ncbi:MAG: HEAT repeat domain-containing protein, partial [Acidobacteria bacterium]